MDLLSFLPRQAHPLADIVGSSDGRMVASPGTMPETATTSQRPIPTGGGAPAQTLVPMKRSTEMTMEAP